MASIDTFLTYDTEADPQMKSLRHSFPQSRLALKNSEPMSPQVTTDDMLKRIQRMAHDMWMQSTEYLGGSRTMVHVLRSKKQGIELRIEILAHQDTDIKKQASSRLNKLLGQTRISCLDKSDGKVTPVPVETRNLLLENAVGRMTSLVYIDADDMFDIALRQLKQDEPDWQLIVEPSAIWVDPGETPQVGAILLTECFLKSTNWKIEVIGSPIDF